MFNFPLQDVQVVHETRVEVINILKSYANYNFVLDLGIGCSLKIFT